MNITEQLKEEAKRQKELRSQGVPPHVMPRVKRSNSWQARYWLRRSMGK